MTTYDDIHKINEKKKLIDLVSYSEDNKDPILCNHCLRTISNGIRCMGICVADNDY